MLRRNAFARLAWHQSVRVRANPQILVAPRAVAVPEGRETSQATASSDAAAAAARPTSTIERPATVAGQYPGSAPSSSLPPLEERPGVLDDFNFEQHWSVAHWRQFVWPPVNADLQSLTGVAGLAAHVGRNIQRANVLSDRESALYWAYHVARCAFFSAQGLSAVILHSAVTGSLWRGEATSTSAPSVPLSRFVSGAALNLPAEAMGAFEQDLRCIKAGEYKLPWDMTTGAHRQNSILSTARDSARFMRSAVEVLNARREQRVGDLWVGRSTMYPEYYLNNFHFQSDGWFSSRSAAVYDFSTETLFVGRQDAMQRATLVPISRHLKERGMAGGRGARLLEVGAGTGRFATFVRDNHPHADLLVSDLSPFYLERARTQMRDWERLRGKAAAGGACSFVQAQAEQLPVDDASMDVVYSVYMFHEMPKHARDQALREMARVLKPGGLLVITDSIQWGDRPDKDASIGGFTKFNEPHYLDYVGYDFGSAMKAAGLEPGLKLLQSSSKTLSATKPE